MIFNRLCVGTANWGKEYNGAKVSEDDQKRILDYCQCGGIDMIDTATAYGWDWTRVSSYFKVVVKYQTDDSLKKIYDRSPHGTYCVMAHNPKIYRSPATGVSLYEPQKLRFSLQPKVVQIPYSLFDRRAEAYFPEWKTGYDPIEEIHVRSVFLRGKIIKAGVEPWKCIAFCLMNPYVDRVIIGADSFEQFKENLRPFHRMNVMAKDDINLLDPRKWKED
jgi:aryl-alcohol dehydrogenase-like predicted oxidoreductase